MWNQIPPESWVRSSTTVAIAGTTAVELFPTLAQNQAYYLTQATTVAAAPAGNDAVIRILSNGLQRWALGAPKTGVASNVTFDPPLYMGNSHGVSVQPVSTLQNTFISLNGFKAATSIL